MRFGEGQVQVQKGPSRRCHWLRTAASIEANRKKQGGIGTDLPRLDDCGPSKEKSQGTLSFSHTAY